MALKRLFSTATVICLLVWSLLCPALALALPGAQAGCAGNVLLNPSFEEGFSARGSGEVTVANGWHPWYQDGPGQEDGYNRRPEYQPEDASRHTMRRIHSGNYAQKYFNSFATHNAGIFQQVQVAVGSKLTFSIWVQAWSSEDPNPDAVKNPGNYRVSIGIDPTGGTNALSSSVVWTEPRMEYNTWMHLEVQSVAQAGTVTVFTRGNPEFRNRFNDSYWDDACMTVVAATPKATAVPKKTATPTLSPAPEPSPTSTSTPTSTPATGDICVSVFEDANADGRRAEGEPLIAGAVVSLFDSNRMELEKYTTDGLSEPYCFSGLAAGTYYLKRQNPASYTSTVPDDWGVAVAPGVSTSVELGARLVPGPTSTLTATRTQVPTPTPTPRPVAREVGNALYQISGIIVAGLALAVPVGLRYLRRYL